MNVPPYKELRKRMAIPLIRVLVVDDHDLVRTEVSRALSRAGGIEVVGLCVDGEDAIAQAAVANPDVILMDLSMPRLDGVQATRQIVNSGSRARIVVLTSAAGGRLMLDAREAGAHSFVYKSADIADVIQAVRNAAPPSLIPTV
jgi:DNA-binding NarL/FixJ family response regulator